MISRFCLFILFYFFNSTLVSAASVSVKTIEPLLHQVERLIELKRVSSSVEDAGMGTAQLFKFDNETNLAFVRFDIGNGGNGYTQYLAVFSTQFYDKKTNYSLVDIAPIGARLWRSINSEGIINKDPKNNEISIVYGGVAWGEGDPGCCPTDGVNVTFIIKKGRISEKTVLPNKLENSNTKTKQLPANQNKTSQPKNYNNQKTIVSPKLKNLPVYPKNDMMEYEIEISHNDELFVINGQKYEAQTYCFNTEKGDRVVFLEGNSLGACVSAKVFNRRTGEMCELWCD